MDVEELETSTVLMVLVTGDANSKVELTRQKLGSTTIGFGMNLTQSEGANRSMKHRDSIYRTQAYKSKRGLKKLHKLCKPGDESLVSV